MTIQVADVEDHGSQRITSVADPTSAQDAATKNYVDTHSGNGGTYSADIGDGASTSFTITHNFNTRDILVSILDKGTNEFVAAYIVATSVNVVTVSNFLAVPTTNQYRVTVQVGGSAVTQTYATPAIALGSSAAGGAVNSVIRSDATIAAFDTTAPSTQAYGDAAAVGTAAFAARRDHKHGMPAAYALTASDILATQVFS